MKALFWVGSIGLVVLEIALVYFIMPMPGSQRMRSIELAYALYQWRWAARSVFGLMVLAGLLPAWRSPGRLRYVVPVALLVVAGVTYAFNFRMAADHMFLQPTVVNMQPASANTVAPDRLVVGIEMDGQSRAYPLQYIGYHHQVRDTLAGKPILVSYCTVCRTGRVFRPTVHDSLETFRLVGMDHFNAMFEDRTTGSWWRQANGEAIIGPRKGAAMPELPSVQVSLKQWMKLHPETLVMQADPAFTSEYAKDYAYERGTRAGGLTGTDTASWRDKSWVVGVAQGGAAKAYDWKRLRRERVINDTVGGVPIVLALGPDTVSYFAFQRPDAATQFALRGDSLVSAQAAYALNGKGPAGNLAPINASQEFWHSWRTFQPATARY
ncbi:MAG: DUF3179 domain-containing protein [Gemmatimonadaceae bacterium]|nr:DUF3179 domain-containing protein [Gemmatimonadaceae bacterium]